MTSAAALTDRRAPRAWRAETSAMLSLAWPMIMTNLAQTAMTTTDVMFMGRLGPQTLAAGALGTNLYFAPLIFGLGLMIATAPMMATQLGRKRHSVRDVRRTVRQGLWSALAVSTAMWVLLWNTQAILAAMGQEPALAAEAGRYVRALQWGVLPFYGFLVLRSFLAALERPGWALAIALLALAFNAVANWCLIFGNAGFPALGIMGSGIATSLSNLLMFAGLVAVIGLDRQFRRYRLFGRWWLADWPRFVALWRLGLPVSGLLLFEVSIFNAAAFLMGLIDVASLAAYTIAIQLSSISFMVPLGLGQAVTVRIGLAYGARDPQGVRLAGWTAYGLSTFCMAVLALAMFVFPRPLVSAFIDAGNPGNATVVHLAITFLAYAALFQIVDGAQAVGGGMLRGLHDTKVPMVFAAIGYWGVGLPLGVLLAFGLGFRGAGIWIGLCSGLAVVAVLLLARWLRRESFYGAEIDAQHRIP